MIYIDRTEAYKEDRVKDIELRVRDLCLEGIGLVPKVEAMPELKALRRELIDITDGENTIMFDKKGRPSPVYVIPCDVNARVDQYSHLFNTVGKLGGAWDSIFPCFIRNNDTSKYLFIQKYRGIRDATGNRLIGLYQMPHGYGGGGEATFSYNGVALGCDKLNDPLTMTYEDGLDVHEITWDEYGFLVLKALKDAGDSGFETHGNDYYGKSYDFRTDPRECGAPCGYKYNNQLIHTLTGSGPNTWRHNNKVTGIADLRGNTRLILSGIRTFGGEIQVIDFRSTDGSLSSVELSGSSGLWKAISVDAQGITQFVAPGSADTFKIDYLEKMYEIKDEHGKVTSVHRSGHQIATKFTESTRNLTNESFYSSMFNGSVKLASGVVGSPLLEYLNLIPYKKGLKGQQYFVNTPNAERMLLSGASWYNDSDGGLSCRDGDNSFDNAYDSVGVLLAARAEKLE